MPSLSLAGALLAAGLAISTAATVAVVATARSVPDPRGHLILQVEGDANTLRITRITPKVDPCGLQRITSEYAVVVRDAQGLELGRVPLDLSKFDLDPSRVGGALRVEGCVVRDPRVATLVNVPHWPTASTVEILHGVRPLGMLAADSYVRLVQEGELR